MSEINVTDDDFNQQIIESEVPVLVDFWAPWCGPCKMLTPTIESIAKEYEGKIKVAKVNTDEAHESAQKYGIQSIPTLMVFVKGEVKATTMGVQPREAITKMVEEAL